MMMMPQRKRLSFKKLSKTESSIKYTEHVGTTAIHIMMLHSKICQYVKCMQVGKISSQKSYKR